MEMVQELLYQILKKKLFQKKYLDSLNHASLNGKENVELMFNLGLEYAMQRNLDAALDNAMMHADAVAGNSGKGWKLLALVLSADQRLKDGETIVDCALEEIGSMDRFVLLRLKVVLQIAQEQPKQEIETNRTLLAMIQAQRELHSKNSDEGEYFKSETLTEKNMEMAAWQDVATIYIKLESWLDSEIHAEKTKSITPSSRHTTGTLFEAQSLHKEALVFFSISMSIEPDYVPSIVLTAEKLMKVGYS